MYVDLTLGISWYSENRKLLIGTKHAKLYSDIAIILTKHINLVKVHIISIHAQNVCVIEGFSLLISVHSFLCTEKIGVNSDIKSTLGIKNTFSFIIILIAQRKWCWTQIWSHFMIFSSFYDSSECQSEVEFVDTVYRIIKRLKIHYHKK